MTEWGWLVAVGSVCKGGIWSARWLFGRLLDWREAGVKIASAMRRKLM